VNPYAALPSLHVGWNLLIALGLCAASRQWPLRAIVFLLPTAMLLATVVTGNHFFIDCIAGALLAVCAFVIAFWMHGNWPSMQALALRLFGRRGVRAETSP
jgi:membrane-associated phospholipid phosphatase